MDRVVKGQAPIIVKIGKAAYTLAVWRLGDGRFAFDYREGSKRKIVARRTREALEEAAGRIALRLHNGETEALQLSPADCRIYATAREAAAPLGLHVDRAVAMLADAAKLAGGAEQVIEAARWYARSRTQLVQATVPEVVAQYISTLAADGVSPAYEKKMKADLDRFAAAFGGPVSDCRAAEIDAWLRGLRTIRDAELSRRRRRNLRDSIVTLFRFARSRGYVPGGLITEAEKVKRPKVARQTPAIYTPDELLLLIQQCHQPPDARRGRRDYRDFLPALLIGAFAGLRWSEIARLSWRDIHFDDASIEVPEQTKTGRRLVPILANLAAWLRFYRDRHGLVCPFRRHDDVMRRITARAGLPVGTRRYANALRHSFITYRVAAVKNIPQVASEAGNSVGEIKRSYLNPQLAKVADRWFALAPDGDAKIVQMPLGLFASR